MTAFSEKSCATCLANAGWRAINAELEAIELTGADDRRYVE